MIGNKAYLNDILGTSWTILCMSTPFDVMYIYFSENRNVEI